MIVTREIATHQARRTAGRSALIAIVVTSAGVLGAACGGSTPTVTVRIPPPPPQQVVVNTPPPPSAPTCPNSAEYSAISGRAELTLNYNAPSNFGGGALTTGFSPDPWGFHLTAGGGSDGIDVSTLGIRDETSCQPCSRSFVTRRPDFHFTFEAGQVFEMVRFYVVTDNAADATLLINTPNTAWRCNDDHGHADWGNSLMPAIDFHSPPSGRYDIWVGTFDRSAHNPATLYVTEINGNHP